MFSLPIFMVPTSGSPEASATGMAPLSSIATLEEIEVESVSNKAALAKAIEVAASVIAPSSVVSEKEATVPP